MRALLQRVSESSVESLLPDGTVAEASIGAGLMILLGVKAGDTAADAEWLAARCAGLRIFADEEGKMNRSLLELDGEALVVSQFTLYGGADRGRRPSFVAAAPPAEAVLLYEAFVAALKAAGVRRVATGVFQAMMRVRIVNEGPVTLLLESRPKPDRETLEP